MKPAHHPSTDTPPGEPQKRLASWYAPGLSDGIGDRLLMFDNTSAPSLELLRFRAELAASPEFEIALRERVDRLRRFSHPSFARVRAVERLSEDDGLALVSNHTPGKRLSEVLAEARGPAFAMELVRQLTPALAILHRQGDRIAHGALGADRIVVTPEGRLVIVEHVLGSALERLRLPASRLRAELGIVVPTTSDPAGPGLDHHTDILQLGLVALSLLAGRRIRPDEYPLGVEELLNEVHAAAAGPTSSAALPVMHQWLEHALQINGRVFDSAHDAQDALSGLPRDGKSRKSTATVAPVVPFPAPADSVPDHSSSVQQHPPAPTSTAQHLSPAPRPEHPPLQIPPRDSLAEFAAEDEEAAPIGTPRYLSPEPQSARPTPRVPPSELLAGFADETREVTPIGTPEYLSLEPKPARPALQMPPGDPLAGFADETPEVTPTGTPQYLAPEPQPTRPILQMPPGDPLAGFADKFPEVAPVSAPTADARHVEERVAPIPPALPIEPGTASAVPDRAAQEPAAAASTPVASVIPVTGSSDLGKTLHVESAVLPTPRALPESHPIEARKRSWQRVLAGRDRMLTAAVALLAVGEAFVIAALLYAPARPAAILIETGQPGTTVLVDGEPAGVTPLQLQVGTDTRLIRLVNPEPPAPEARKPPPAPARARTNPVAKQAEPTPAAVAAAAARSRPSGIRLVSPIELQVFEGGRLVGSTADASIAVPPGRHEFDLVNKDLGYRLRQVVNIPPEQIVQVGITPPDGRLSINALPWAEVWINGRLVGETPLGNLAVPLGEHEIVFRHPQLGEQRQTAIVKSDGVTRVTANLQR